MNDYKKMSILSLLFFTLELGLLELQIDLDQISNIAQGHGAGTFSIWYSFFSVALIVSGTLTVLLYVRAKEEERAKKDAETGVENGEADSAH